MIQQYPHTVYITIPETAVQDSNGNWIKATGTGQVIEQNCRLEPRIGRFDSYIMAADGSRIEISSILYMPVSAPDIKVGCEAEVRNGTEVLVKTTVKQFSKGQLNARIWL